MYGQTLVSLGYDAMARGRLIQGFAREIEQFAPHYLEEMRGIAAGAGVTFEDVVMINARTEVIAKARAEKKSGRAGAGRRLHRCADPALALGQRPADPRPELGLARRMRRHRDRAARAQRQRRTFSPSSRPAAWRAAA